MTGPQTSVIVLAYGMEPYLGECIHAVLDGAGTNTQVIVVDNGAHDAAAALPADPRVEIVRPAQNLGFAGGCNEGARRAHGDVLVFVNSDAIVVSGAIARLAAALNGPSVGMATGSLRLASDPDLMNSAGNPVHYLGFAWAGGFGDPARAHARQREVTAVSGAFFAIRRQTWESLGGFVDELFAYHEDTELSLRVWQRGWRVAFEPSAVAFHHYEFGRSAVKQYLVERNRWITVLTVFPAPVLAAVLPAMLACELPLAMLALVQGWAGQKLAAWRWLLSHRRWLRQRRAVVQGVNTLSSAGFGALLHARLDESAPANPPAARLLNLLLVSYWAVVRIALRPRYAVTSDSGVSACADRAVPAGGLYR